MLFKIFFIFVNKINCYNQNKDANKNINIFTNNIKVK